MKTVSGRFLQLRVGFLGALLIATMALSGFADELKPFETGSLEEIRNANKSKPFILAFWSLHCAPCKEEMVLLKSLKARFPGVTIVLVSTDPPESHPAVRKFLTRQELGKIENWAFASDYDERLRYAVVRGWRGELPRTYLYDSAHRAIGHSGLLKADMVTAWLERETSGKWR